MHPRISNDVRLASLHVVFILFYFALSADGLRLIREARFR